MANRDEHKYDNEHWSLSELGCAGGKQVLLQAPILYRRRRISNGPESFDCNTACDRNGYSK